MTEKGKKLAMLLDLADFSTSAWQSEYQETKKKDAR